MVVLTVTRNGKDEGGGHLTPTCRTDGLLRFPLSQRRSGRSSRGLSVNGQHQRTFLLSPFRMGTERGRKSGADVTSYLNNSLPMSSGSDPGGRPSDSGRNPVRGYGAGSLHRRSAESRPGNLAEIAESPVLHPLRMLGNVRVADAIEISHSHTGHGVIHRGRESVMSRKGF